MFSVLITFIIITNTQFTFSPLLKTELMFLQRYYELVPFGNRQFKSLMRMYSWHFFSPVHHLTSTWISAFSEFSILWVLLSSIITVVNQITWSQQETAVHWSFSVSFIAVMNRIGPNSVLWVWLVNSFHCEKPTLTFCLLNSCLFVTGPSFSSVDNLVSRASNQGQSSKAFDKS